MSYSYLHVIEKLQEKLKFTLFLPLPIFQEIKKAESLDFYKILSLARLPIPTLPRANKDYYIHGRYFCQHFFSIFLLFFVAKF